MQVSLHCSLDIRSLWYNMLPLFESATSNHHQSPILVHRHHHLNFKVEKEMRQQKA